MFEQQLIFFQALRSSSLQGSIQVSPRVFFVREKAHSPCRNGHQLNQHRKCMAKQQSPESIALEMSLPWRILPVRHSLLARFYGASPNIG